MATITASEVVVDVLYEATPAAVASAASAAALYESTPAGYVSEVTVDVLYTEPHIFFYATQAELTTHPGSMKGDRSAWDIIEYPAYHARDIDELGFQHHVPEPGQADDIIVDNGTIWTRATQAALKHSQFSENDQDVHPQYAEIASTESITGVWTFDTSGKPPFNVINTVLQVDNLNAELHGGYTVQQLINAGMNAVLTDDDGNVLVDDDGNLITGDL